MGGKGVVLRTPSASPLGNLNVADVRQGSEIREHCLSVSSLNLERHPERGNVNLERDHCDSFRFSSNLLVSTCMRNRTPLPLLAQKPFTGDHH